MRVHFICTGNAYRSRLAEAYFNSKQIAGFIATSSGIRADYWRPSNGPISIYTKELLEKENILKYTTEDVTQTTLARLEKQEFIVFMNQVHFEFCVNELGYEPSRYEIWDIKDVNEILTEAELAEKEKVDEVARKTYGKIKDKIDKLILKLKEGEEIVV
jgi:protein-tyrosine-phosphatase